ncbi:MAG: hypothetical protein ACUVST_05895 [Anaerolineae bacterium]
MNNRKIVSACAVLLALVLLAGSVSLSWSAPPEPEAAPPPGPDTYLIDAPPSPEGPGRTDVVAHGTAWQPQVPKNFSLFQKVGWGTVARRKTTGGDEWVHIAVPMITRLEDRLQKIAKVQFCAKSSNGAATRPTRVDLWGDNTMFKSQVIGWPADNAYHCVDILFDPPVWQPTLGVSVLVHFANATDLITLYRAWADLRD